MRQRILVVEDDPDMASLLTYTLKRAGYSVGTAEDGVEGIKKARSLRPDVILLDLMLPELDGYAVCEVLRRDSGTAGIPIIVVTAQGGQLSQLAGLEAGANEYITKPFSTKHLLSRVRAWAEPLPDAGAEAAKI